MTQQTNNMSWNEALAEYGIGFAVEKRPLVALMGEGESQLVDNLYGICRTDTGTMFPGIGVNGRYECIQTQSYADIGNLVTSGLNAQFVNGGSFRGGALVYLQAKLPQSIRVRGTDDIIDKLLTFVTSHDGTTCFMLMPTALRIFCQNQMNALNRAARDGIKIRHTRSAEKRLEDADRKILEVMDAYRTFELKVNFLADQRFNDLQMEQAVRSVFNVDDEEALADLHKRTKNNIEGVLENFEGGLGIDGSNRGTAWAAYNAFTQWSDHQRKTNKGTDAFEAKLLGSGASFKHKALNAIEGLLAA
jgi:phage/plasmid-like protein (TIGR03299 family)